MTSPTIARSDRSAPTPNLTPDVETEQSVRTSLGRDFLTVWAGQSASALGSQMSAIAVAVFVFVETGSVWWLALLGMLAGLPSLLVLPVSGRLDVLDRRRVMIGADVVAAVGPIVGLVLVVSSDVSMTLLAVVTSIGGLGTAMQIPAYQASIPALVSRESLARANGLVQLQQAVALVAAPAFATPLLALGGMELVFVVDIATFVFGVVATWSVAFRSGGLGARRNADFDEDEGEGCVDGDRAIERADVDGVEGGARAGWAWLRSSGRPLLRFLVALGIVNFFLSFFNVGLLGLATELGGAGRAGWPLAAGGLAMIAGSLAVGARGLGRDRVRVAMAAFVPVVAGALVCAVRPTFVSLFVGVAIALAAVPVANAAISTMFHEQVPEELHGRVFAVRSASAATLQPLGSLFAGLSAIWLAGGSGVGGVDRVVDTVVGAGPARVPGALMLVAAVGLASVVAVLALGPGSRSRRIPTDSGPGSP